MFQGWDRSTSLMRSPRRRSQRLFEIHDVHGHQLGATLDPTLLERFENGLVLDLEALGLSRRADDRDLVAAQRRLQLLVQAGQLAVRGEPHEPIVEAKRRL